MLLHRIFRQFAVLQSKKNPIIQQQIKYFAPLRPKLGLTIEESIARLHYTNMRPYGIDANNRKHNKSKITKPAKSYEPQ